MNGLEMLCHNDFGPSSVRLFVPSVVHALLVRSDVDQDACPGITRHQAEIHPGWDASAFSIGAELVVKYCIQSSEYMRRQELMRMQTMKHQNKFNVLRFFYFL